MKNNDFDILQIYEDHRRI